MELLAGNCRKRAADDFAEDVDPFDSSEWMYGSRSLRTQGNDDDALATLADLAPPPQKLKPIRCVVVKPPAEDRHPLDILAGSLDRLPPEMGFLGGDGGCFEAPLGSKIADVEESGQLTRGFAKDEVEVEVPGRVSRHDGVSLSSSVDSDSDSDSSQRVRKGKRKRKTREKKMEHFVEKLVGSMMKRQEKMHNQLIMVMEKMERERISSEEAWRQQEIERMKQDEEARMQEISRSSSIISFIKSVIGEDIQIPNLTNPLSKQCEPSHQRQGDVKFVFPSGRRWPHEEVQALIDSRSQVEEKTGMHKVAIWDDVSAKMKERGYERSAKKCKEKWENMNKYYKRVVEGKKTQPEHSKTRSYFEKLGNFYKTNSVEKEE